LKTVVSIKFVAGGVSYVQVNGSQVS